MTGRRKLQVALALLAVACSGTQVNNAPPPAGGDGGATAGGSPLPCAVGEALAKNCQQCHAAVPKFGAPMPLVTYEDVSAQAKSDPSKKVHELMAARINDAAKPMPPSGELSAADKKTLNDWLAQSAPAGGVGCETTTVAPQADVGPKFLPCAESEQTTFVAHGADPASKFQVPEDAGNLYECFTAKVPWQGELQATAFAPIIDDARVVHHWILYATSTPQADGGIGKCKMPLDAQFLSGWAPGGKNNLMPADVGLALPKSDQWLILQVHYWNVARYTDSMDRSGVAMCTTKPGEPRPKTAVVSTLGSLGIAIPPRAVGHTVTGSCTPSLTEPAHILAAGPHMHGRGSKFNTTVLRGGDATKSEMLVDVARWDFSSQTSYPKEMTINPGDVLKTTCTYDNPSDARVFFGEKTEDEMCFNFVTVWPAPGLWSSGGATTHRCIGL